MVLRKHGYGADWTDDVANATTGAVTSTVGKVADHAGDLASKADNVLHVTAAASAVKDVVEKGVNALEGASGLDIDGDGDVAVAGRAVADVTDVQPTVIKPVRRCMSPEAQAMLTKAAVCFGVTAVFITVFALIFGFGEGWGGVESVYFVIVTISTVGCTVVGRGSRSATPKSLPFTRAPRVPARAQMAT